MKKGNKILLIILFLVIISILNGCNLICKQQKDINNKSNLQTIEVKDMKYPRQNPIIRKMLIPVDIEKNIYKNRITVFGGDINDKNIITEESFILDESNENISERKVKEIKSFFNNLSNYYFIYDNSNVIVKLPDDNLKKTYGIEIYDTKTGKMRLLKSKPTLKKEEVGDCIDVLNNYLFIWSGISADPENGRIEIIDLKNDKKSTLTTRMRGFGLIDSYIDTDIIFILGGIDNGTELPSREIHAINLKKMTIENAGQLIKPQVKPNVFYADISSDGGTNISIDKNTIQIFSVYPFLYYYPKSVYVGKCIKLSNKLRNYNVKYLYSDINFNNYLLFENDKHKISYITNVSFNNIKIIKRINYVKRNINYYELDYKTLLLLIYEQR